MKCQKCGSEIKDGHLYCDVCGEEIRIVPDFDATVDENIDIHFTDDIDTAGVIEGLNQVATKEIAKDIELEATREIDIKRHEIDDKPGDRFYIKALVITGAICVVLVVLGLFINKKVNNFYSVDSQYEEAFELYDAGKHEESIKLLKRLSSIDDSDTRIKTLLADNYYELGKYDESNAVLYDLVDKFGNDPFIIEKIIINDEAKGDYNAINQILKETDDALLKENYAKYFAPDVVFSVEEGSYGEQKLLELTTSDNCKIYYSLELEDDENNDANEDDKKAGLIPYTDPIELANGKYLISAFSVSEFGIEGEKVSKEYIVDCYIPDAPIVKTKAGIYNVPVPIEVMVPDYELCYYTIDGEDPTRDDELYVGSIPMYIGKHVYKFAVISNKDSSSEVVSIETTLDLIVLVDMEMATNAIINYKAAKGSNEYTYKCEQACVYNNSTYYIVNEYTESLDGDNQNSKVQTGNHYAVDVLNGMTFRAILNKSTGEYLLEALV